MRLCDIEADFFPGAVEKKALAEQVIKKEAEIGSWRAEITRLCKPLEKHPVAQDKNGQRRGSQTLSTVHTR